MFPFYASLYNSTFIPIHVLEKSINLTVTFQSYVICCETSGMFFLSFIIKQTKNITRENDKPIVGADWQDTEYCWWVLLSPYRYSYLSDYVWMFPIKMGKNWEKSRGKRVAEKKTKSEAEGGPEKQWKFWASVCFRMTRVDRQSSLFLPACCNSYKVHTWRILWWMGGHSDTQTFTRQLLVSCVKHSLLNLRNV